MNEIIIGDSQTRSFEQLSENEKKLVQDKLSSLDYMNPVSIIRFGSENSRTITTILVEMISRFKVKDFEDAQLLINNLVDNLKKVDSNTLLKSKKKGILLKIPFVERRAKENVKTVFKQQVSIARTVEEVEDKLVATKVTLMEDMELCFRLVKETYEYTKKQEIEYITIQKALEKINEEKEQLEELYRQYPNNIEYSYKISELNRVIERLKVKAHSFLLFRESTLQSVAQIDLVQRKDELMILKIEDAIWNKIALWKRNFAIAQNIYYLNNAIIIEKTLGNETNELLRKNSEMLNDMMLEKAIEKERPSMRIKTFRKFNKNLEETFDGLRKADEEARKIRKDAQKAIQRIEILALKLQSRSGLEQLEGKNVSKK